jgi:lipoprotein-anchoring transpeptidase ErfK/SrfK
LGIIPLMNKGLSRRDFLKLGALGLSSLAFRPYFGQGEELDGGLVARVAIDSVSVYSQPNDKSRILYQRFRDELLNVYSEITSPDGPGYNPVWYKVWRGYVHRAHLQLVKVRLNDVLSEIKNDRQLCEITVPLSQSMRFTKAYGWQKIYRMYYESTHWVTGIEEGPDGTAWYRVMDELIDMEYFVKAEHLRPIPDEELTPIAPDVDPELKRIEVSISKQSLVAYEGDKIVLDTRISSGLPDRRDEITDIPTDTPTGIFNIQSKMPSKHMGGGQLTDDLKAYIIPGVPWTCFFEPKTGVATHGTYWHNNFGMQMSHGCVNMVTEEAKWLFRWTTPMAEPNRIETLGRGTKVIVS